MMSYIRKHYKVPARIGSRVRFEGKHEGTIRGSHGGYIRVRFDGDENIVSLHPTWRLEYLEWNAKEVLR